MSRAVRGTFMACVIDSGLAEPVAEADVESSLRSFGISVRRGDWIDRMPPQTGDRVTLVRDGRTLRLSVSGGGATAEVVAVDAAAQVVTGTECWIPIYAVSGGNVANDLRGAFVVPCWE